MVLGSIPKLPDGTSLFEAILSFSVCSSPFSCEIYSEEDVGETIVVVQSMMDLKYVICVGGFVWEDLCGS